ncbi:MAG: enoyl-CoA hydratase/isomerase family protein [Desulfobacterales bacterium]|nr:enoyl-CoA hydratase/isomerase family protein [Desulfobacterales bacterium]
MKTVLLEHSEDIAILRLNNGVTNAISPQLVYDLSAAVNECRNLCRGLILTGGSKFFSIGFDLPTLLPLNRNEIADFYNRFNRTALDIFTLPLPTVCAISGHAIAGGTILALACDYRFAAQENKLLGLNEIKLGVPVPHLADLMLRHIVAERAATEIVYCGEFITAADSRQIGLVDEICLADTLEARAVEKVLELAALPAPAFAQIKDARVAGIRSEFLEKHPAKTRGFLDCWFDPAVRVLLTEAAKKF